MLHLFKHFNFFSLYPFSLLKPLHYLLLITFTLSSPDNLLTILPFLIALHPFKCSLYLLCPIPPFVVFIPLPYSFPTFLFYLFCFLLITCLLFYLFCFLFHLFKCSLYPVSYSTLCSPHPTSLFILNLPLPFPHTSTHPAEPPRCVWTPPSAFLLGEGICWGPGWEADHPRSVPQGSATCFSSSGVALWGVCKKGEVLQKGCCIR